MVGIEYRRLTFQALGEMMEYVITRGWTIWTDGVVAVVVDPERGREAFVSVYRQMIDEKKDGSLHVVSPPLLVKRLGRDKGWRKVKTIRRPGAFGERQVET